MSKKHQLKRQQKKKETTTNQVTPFQKAGIKEQV